MKLNDDLIYMYSIHCIHYTHTIPIQSDMTYILFHSKCDTIRFPFDWTHPALYLVSISGQFIWSIYAFNYVGCFLFLALGAFLFAISVTKDLKNLLLSIKKMANRSQSLNLDGRMYRKLSIFIRTHANLKQLSE